jgi:hypothetical protein
MEVRRDKKSIWTSLDTSPLFFHIVSKLFQALFTTYDEIFQALAVGDILLLKSFLDPIPPNVQPQLGPLGLPRVRQTEKENISEAGDFRLSTLSKQRP